MTKAWLKNTFRGVEYLYISQKRHNFEMKKIEHDKKILLIIITAFIVLNCKNESQTFKLLSLTDSLLQKNENDSALHVLKKINIKDIKDSSEIAYYNLLNTQTLHRLYIPIVSDSAINISVRYYEKTTDKEKTARAYYYKGVLSYSLKKVEEATYYFKRGKYIAAENGNKIWMHHFEEYLAFINHNSGNYRTALKHAYEALKLSSDLKRSDLIAEDLNNLSTVLCEMDDEDKMEYYLKKTLKYIYSAPKKLQPQLYTNIGIYYFNNNDFIKAKKYINKSLSTNPTPTAYYVLGSILQQQGHEAEAWVLWSKALDTDDIALKAEVMQWMADFKKDKGEYKEATLLTDSINILNDSLKNMQKAETVMHIQKNIELNDHDHQAYIRTRIIVCTAVALVVVFVLFIIYHAGKISRTKNIIADNRRMMEKHTAEFEKMTKSNKTNEREINRLKKKIEEIRERNSEILGHGQKLWNEIMAGGNTALWRKADYEAAVEYMRTKRPDVMDGIEKRYSRLTASATLYILLTVEGWTEDKIQEKMNMTPGALRTMKYRVKKSKREG